MSAHGPRRPQPTPRPPGPDRQLLRPRYFFVPGQACEDREHRRQAGLPGLQRGFYAVEDLLLAGGQTHHLLRSIWSFAGGGMARAGGGDGCSGVARAGRTPGGRRRLGDADRAWRTAVPGFTAAAGLISGRRIITGTSRRASACGPRRVRRTVSGATASRRAEENRRSPWNSACTSQASRRPLVSAAALLYTKMLLTPGCSRPITHQSPGSGATYSRYPAKTAADRTRADPSRPATRGQRRRTLLNAGEGPGG
jgi:hypothetical protein